MKTNSTSMSRYTRLSFIVAAILIFLALLVAASWFMQVFGRGGY